MSDFLMGGGLAPEAAKGQPPLLSCGGKEDRCQYSIEMGGPLRDRAGDVVDPQGVQLPIEKATITHNGKPIGRLEKIIFTPDGAMLCEAAIIGDAAEVVQQVVNLLGSCSVAIPGTLPSPPQEMDFPPLPLPAVEGYQQANERLDQHLLDDISKQLTWGERVRMTDEEIARFKKTMDALYQGCPEGKLTYLAVGDDGALDGPPHVDYPESHEPEPRPDHVVEG